MFSSRGSQSAHSRCEISQWSCVVWVWVWSDNFQVDRCQWKCAICLQLQCMPMAMQPQRSYAYVIIPKQMSHAAWGSCISTSKLLQLQSIAFPFTWSSIHRFWQTIRWWLYYNSSCREFSEGKIGHAAVNLFSGCKDIISSIHNHNDLGQMLLRMPIPRVAAPVLPSLLNIPHYQIRWTNAVRLLEMKHPHSTYPLESVD